MNVKQSPKLDALVVMKALEKTAQPVIKQLKSFKVKTLEDFDMAGARLKELKEYGKQAIERQDALVTPLQAVISDIRTLFRPFRTAVQETEETVKTEMLAFVQSNKAKTLKLEADFEAGKIKKVDTLLSKTNALEVHSGSAQIRKIWTAVPIAPERTPRKFLVPDEAAIKAALKEGKKVDGWEWKQVESIAV